MQKLKVVTGKIGLDDHFRGIIVVSDILRKAGMEVVYLGAGQRIDGVINTMMQEDADAVGLSFQCGGYVQIMGMFMKRLRELKMDHAAVFIGGTIHPHEISSLKELGIDAVFLPGATEKEISTIVKQKVMDKKAAA